MSDSQAGTRHHAVAIGVLMALTFATGIADAIGYLGLDRVFTGNMTGNVLILGMGVAGADGLPVLGPVVALVAFTAGSFTTGRVLRAGPSGWHTRITAALCAGGIVQLVVACSFAASGEPSHIHAVAAAALIALVMGEQATVARALSVRDLTTVVVTSTLTSFASESLNAAGTAGSSRWWNRRSGAIAVIFLGAVFGALVLRIDLAAAAALAAVITLSVAAVGHCFLTPRRDRPAATAA